MDKKSILIIGGTGVISFAIVNEAIRQGYCVTCINRGKSRNQVLPPEVEVIKADYHNAEYILSKIGDRVFDSVLDILCYKREDISYSLNLFAKHCKQYFFFSSAEAYNKGKYKDEIYDETVELVNPLWSYSINKAACEVELIKLARKYNVKYTIIRPAITYGNTRIPYGIMPSYGYHGTLIKRMEHNKPTILWNDGKNLAMITRVEDFAIGFIGLIGNRKAFNQSFHIVGDEAYSWKSVTDCLADILNVTPIYISMPSDSYAAEIPMLSEQLLGGRSIDQRLDNYKLKSVVPEFKTTIPLKLGISYTVEYYKSHNYLNGIDWKFDADTDRIISRYCKKNGLSTEGMNLGFVDYLGSATIYDRLIYWLEFHKDNTMVRLCSKIVKLCSHVYNEIVKYL